MCLSVVLEANGLTHIQCADVRLNLIIQVRRINVPCKWNGMELSLQFPMYLID